MAQPVDALRQATGKTNNRRKGSGLVVGPSGKPLVGARVRVVGVKARAEGFYGHEAVDDAEARVVFEDETVTNEDGTFLLSKLPELVECDFFLYVDVLGYQMWSRSFKLQEWRSVGLVVTLVPHEPVSLRVLSAGKPLGGADIFQEGLFMPASASASKNLLSLDRRRLYRKRAVTADSGLAQLPYTNEPTVVWAQHAGTSTSHFIGLLAGEHVLNLKGGAKITGHVVGIDPIKLAQRGALTVRDAQNGTVIGVTALRASGEFGPLVVGLDGPRDVFVQATVGQLRSVAQLRQITPGADLQLSIAFDSGHEVWVQLLTSDGMPIAKGVLWLSKKDWAGRGRRVFHSGNDGYVRCTDVEAGTILLCAFAEGYAMSQMALVVPESEPLTYQLVLNRGGRIEGKVYQHKVPVENFRVHVLDRTGRSTMTPEVFWSEQGEFVIDHVKTGELHLFAESEAGVSHVSHVQVGGSETTTVSLELLELDHLSGTVVDEYSNPIQGSTVRLLMGGAQVGLVSYTGANGQFRIPVSGAIEPMHLEIGAEGYKSKDVGLEGIQAVQRSGLTVELEPKSKVQVQLIGAASEGYSQAEVWVEGLEEHVELFTPEGLATIFVDVPGDLTLIVSGAGFGYRRIPIKVSRWPVSPVRVDLSGDCGAVIELVDFDSQQIAEGVFVVARGQDMLNGGLDSDSSYCWLQGELSCRLGGLAADRYWVRVLDSSGSTLAARWVDCSQQSTKITIRPANAFAEVTVLNGSGTPERNCFVAVQFGDTSTWDEGRTDDRGIATFVVPGACQGSIYLKTQAGCVTWQLPADFTGVEGTQKVIVASSCEGGMRLRLKNSEGPIAGADCQLVGIGYPGIVAKPRLTDSEGIIEFGDLSPGMYRVKSLIPNHWPYIRDHEANREMNIQEIWIPRLANLRVEVRNTAGRALAGKEVRVWTLDFDKDTRVWHEAGAMDVVPANWKTDHNGVLSIPKFAEGNYVCSVENEGGERVEVTVQVVPGQNNTVVIELD